LRKELLNWFSDVLPYPKQGDFEPILYPVLLSLQDRNADVRKNASIVLNLLVPFIGTDGIRHKTSDLFKGAALASLQPFLEGLKSVEPITRPTPSPIRTKLEKSESQKSIAKPKIVKPTSIIAKKESVAEVPVVPDSIILLTSDLKPKESRANSDKGLNKWTFDAPRRKLIDFLAEQAQPHFNSISHGLLFSNAHYKEKDYVAGLKLVNDFLGSEVLDSDEISARLIANCDLILKYLTIRFFDTNTSILIK
jgi:cytoskeleton-associated protein 5